jgi:hypothetical protein
MQEFDAGGQGHPAGCSSRMSNADHVGHVKGTVCTCRARTGRKEKSLLQGFVGFFVNCRCALNVPQPSHARVEDTDDFVNSKDSGAGCLAARAVVASPGCCTFHGAGLRMQIMRSPLTAYQAPLEHFFTCGLHTSMRCMQSFARGRERGFHPPHYLSCW